MHFWNIAKLKSELRRGPLPQRAAFSYLVATVFTYYTAYLYATASSRPALTSTGWASWVIGTLALLLGMVLAYRVNGGDRGTDFMARYIALSWVINIRLVVATVVSALVAVTLQVMLVKSPEARHVAAQVLALFLVTAYAGFSTLWLVSSMRDVARAQASEGSPPQPA